MATKFSISTVYKALDQFTQPIGKMDKANNRFTRNIKSGYAKAQLQVEAFSQSASRNLKRGLLLGGGAAIAGTTLAIKSFISEASKIEDATAGFTPLMGSVERAEMLVSRLNKEAATTPFQFEGISKIAKQLLPVMNGSIEDTADTFRMLGDTAGGNIQKLETITRGYTKALLKGKPDMEALNMISEAGVPIFSEMAKTMGIAQEELFDLSKRGKLTNKDLTKTFKNMTKEGGIFFSGMEIASKTLTGKISTLKDNISLTSAAIGKNLLPILKPLTDRAIEMASIMREWVNNNQELIKQYITKFVKTMKTVIKIIGSVVKIISKVIKIMGPFLPLILGAIAGWKAYQAVLFIAASAQAVLNAVMAANPIALIVVAIGALVGAIVWMVYNWDIVIDTLKKVWQFMLKVWDLGKGLAMFFGGPFIAPFVMVIEVIRNLVTEFDNIKKAFTDGGFIAGIKAIGKAILDGMISPFKATIELFNKLKTGVSKFFGGGEVSVNTEQKAPLPVSTTRETVSRSISESRNTTEVKVTNEGNTKVETDSGIVNPGNSIVLQPSG